MLHDDLQRLSGAVILEVRGRFRMKAGRSKFGGPCHDDTEARKSAKFVFFEGSLCFCCFKALLWGLSR